jgi:hypothetical protein
VGPGIRREHTGPRGGAREDRAGGARRYVLRDERVHRLRVLVVDDEALTGSATQWRNPDTSRGGHRTLRVFLAGTGSAAGAYTSFMAEATLRGYDVVGLRYRNQVHSLDLCGYWPNCAGNLCQQNVMGEFNGCYGADAAVGGAVGGGRARSTTGRAFPDLAQSESYWQYQLGRIWDSSAAHTTAEGFAYNGRPFWSRIVIAGRSQGDETATWITRNKPVITGLVFSAPYTNLNNDRSGDDPNDTTPNGPPHHMKRFGGVWTDVTWDVTPWATTGGAASNTTFANVLDPSTWPAGRIERLFHHARRLRPRLRSWARARQVVAGALHARRGPAPRQDRDAYPCVPGAARHAVQHVR